MNPGPAPVRSIRKVLICQQTDKLRLSLPGHAPTYIMLSMTLSTHHGTKLRPLRPWRSASAYNYDGIEWCHLMARPQRMPSLRAQ